MKKTLSIIAIAASALALVSCGGNAAKKAAEEQSAADSVAVVQQEKKLADIIASIPEEPVLDIVTTKGTIKIKLYADTPLHRANFLKLALSGYYDGTLFHRIIADFMIQAGDPLSKNEAMAEKWGTGGPNYTIPAEFVPTHHHIHGALAAARRGDAANPMKESSGSQFYIVLSEAGCSHLDGQYTIFGETVDGLDVVDAIGKVATDGNPPMGHSRPLDPVKIITIKLDEKLANQ